MSSTVPVTPWQSGRFRAARAGSHMLLFGCMYEDAEIELRAFQPQGHIFCIASAGCTAMKLAARHMVVAVDINPVQLAYVQERLRGAAIQCGSAERILAFARSLGPLTGWHRRTLRTFLALEDPEEQTLYWRRRLDTQRFRAAFFFLFSRMVLRSLYSAAFVNALPPNFGSLMRSRMERCFALHPNCNNPYAHALLLGEMASESKVVEGRIAVKCADAADFLERQQAGTFTGFSLSNILDGANPAYARRLRAAVKHAATPDATVVLRSFREPQYPTGTNHATEDRAMLWGVVDVRPAYAL